LKTSDDTHRAVVVKDSLQHLEWTSWKAWWLFKQYTHNIFQHKTRAIYMARAMLQLRKAVMAKQNW